MMRGMSRYFFTGWSLLCTTIAAVAGFFGVSPASAQEFVLEEVIVTARRRAESLQETPVAVTALDAAALRDAGIQNLADLNQIAPNIEVSSANGSARWSDLVVASTSCNGRASNITRTLPSNFVIILWMMFRMTT